MSWICLGVGVGPAQKTDLVDEADVKEKVTERSRAGEERRGPITDDLQR